MVMMCVCVFIACVDKSKKDLLLIGVLFYERAMMDALLLLDFLVSSQHRGLPCKTTNNCTHATAERSIVSRLKSRGCT